ncbi:MAG: hypothetical protein GWN86_19975 [Desulfobacterales bacterium]|nr:hypothetical protein [Desulfobacterales bacterium]
MKKLLNLMMSTDDERLRGQIADKYFRQGLIRIVILAVLALSIFLTLMFKDFGALQDEKQKLAACKHELTSHKKYHSIEVTKLKRKHSADIARINARNEHNQSQLVHDYEHKIGVMKDICGLY